MKLITKLLMGFLGVSIIVLAAGVIGIYSATTIGKNADLILDDKVPVKDAAMEAMIALISSRDAAAEYLLNTEGLEEIEAEINETLEDYDMWISMIEYGTESAEFKNSPSGEMYRKGGLTIVVPKGSPEMISLAVKANAHHEIFTESAASLVSAHRASLNYDVFIDGKQVDIGNWVLQKEIDHLRWVEKMSQAIAGDSKFLAELDPTKCSFGEWYYAYEAEDSGLMDILEKAEAPHETLHAFGERINATVDPAQRQAIYNDEVLVTLTEIKAVFDEFGSYANPVIDDYNLQTKSYMADLDEASLLALEELSALEELADSDMAQTMRESDATERLVMSLLIGTVIVGFIIAFAIGIILSLRISRPLRSATDLASRLARGEFDIEKLKVKSKDEIGALADSFGKMLDSLKYKARIIEQIANGDLSVKVEKASDKDGLGQSLIEMNSSLNDLLGQVAVAVDQVSTGSSQVSQAGQALSQGAAEQASSLEEISSSLNEINSQSSQNAESAAEANAVAKTASETAENGNEKMRELLSAMERINASSDEIQKVVKVIDDIAFQINLLALNANVEAARAGKYGKGFAVVADEVRNLAVRSAEAVKETTGMVEETNKNVSDGIASAKQTAEQLEQILGGSTKVADFLGEIALASKEQAQGVEQINGGLEQIDQVTQSNTASAEESASAAEELAAQAEQLKAMIARFKLSTDEKQAALSVLGTQKNDRLQHNEAGTEEPDTIAEGEGKDGGNGPPPTDGARPEDVIKLKGDDFSRF